MTAKKKKAPQQKAPKKTTSTTWNSEEAKTPAVLTRAGLLADIPDAEIRATVAERFPDYKGRWTSASPYIVGSFGSRGC